MDQPAQIAFAAGPKKLYQTDMQSTANPAGGAFWFLQGMRGIVSLPAFILFCSFVGFTGFAAESGLGRAEAVFMTGSVWALPAMVLLVTSALGNAALPAAFLTVTLSSIRLMPMVAALIPEIRTRKTRTWALLLVSHFVAVTAWVFTMERVDKVPPEHRVKFFAGFGITLTSCNMMIVGFGYSIVGALPPLVAGTLFFLTPIYFITSIWASAKDIAVYLAMVVGLVLAPLFHQIAPEFDILYTGILGGTLAFAIERLIRARQAKEREGRTP